MDRAELRALTIFDGLDDDQLDELLQHADEYRPDAGVTLFTEGLPADTWWVLPCGGR